VHEKACNLHLYIPPHSAHPPGVLRGLIYGHTARVLRLTTHQSDAEASIKALFFRLCARGYKPDSLRPIFYDAIERAQTRGGTRRNQQGGCLFLHLRHHPLDPQSRVFQRLFRETLLSPPNEPLLPTLHNMNGEPIGLNRMIVAHRRPRNLRNLLFPRRFREAPGSPASSFAETLDSESGAPT